MLVRSFKYHEFRMYEIHTCIWIFFLNLINLNYFVNSTFHFWRFHRIMTIFYMLLIQLSCGKTVEGCFCPVREHLRVSLRRKGRWTNKSYQDIGTAFPETKPIPNRFFLCIFSLQNSSKGISQLILRGAFLYKHRKTMFIIKLICHNTTKYFILNA